MPRNLTISIPDGLNEKMSQLTDVNWSAVCKECISKYVNRRLNPNIEAIIARMKKEKDEVYSSGYLEATNWINQTSFEKVEEAVVGWEEEQKSVYDRCYSGDLPVDVEQLDVYFDRALNEAWRRYWRRISDNTMAGDTFLQGFVEGVNELYRKAK